MKKRLYKTEGANAKLFGVCGGVAEYFDVGIGELFGEK